MILNFWVSRPLITDTPTTTTVNLKKTSIHFSFQIYDNTKDVLKNVDPQVLPKEYGGVMPIAEMVELWKQELAKKRDRLLSYDRMKLLSDRGIITRRNKLTGCSLEDGSVIGSFRKLEVD